MCARQSRSYFGDWKPRSRTPFWPGVRTNAIWACAAFTAAGAAVAMCGLRMPAGPLATDTPSPVDVAVTS